MAKYDDMSFGKAFAAARSDLGSGKTFTYKGKSYSTNTADGKKAAPKASSGGMTSSPRPQPRPEAKSTSGGMTSSPRPQPKPMRVAAGTPTSTSSPRSAAGTPTSGYEPRKAAGTPTSGYNPKPKVGQPLNPNLRTQAGRAAAATQGAAARADTKPAAKPAPAPRARGIFEKIGDFFEGGGYSGMKARERAAAARDKSDQKRK